MGARDDSPPALASSAYKGWDKCVWVKHIKGISAAEHRKRGAKSAFDINCPPDLKEDNLKVTVAKTSTNYLQAFEILNLFAVRQQSVDSSHSETVTSHSLQHAANVHKVGIKQITKFIKRLCVKPMDSVSISFLKAHGVEPQEEETDSVLGQYRYIGDTTLPFLGLELQTETELRGHQEQAIAAVFPATADPLVAKSGVLTLPCGSGKTLTGIAIACRIQKSTLVLCNNSNSVNHWRSEFLRFSNISEKGITRATGEIKDELFKSSGVLITTYSMLAVKANKSKHSQYLVDIVKSRIWGCVLFDEVHHLPASGISSVAANLQGKCKIGLTGTYNREDCKISDLKKLVGPKLYTISLEELRAQHLVANIVMKQLVCDMPPEFMKAYNSVGGKSAHRVRTILSVFNPYKFHTVLSLMKMHEQRGDKTLIFVDNKFEIQEYSKMLSRPFISGDSDKQYRERLFKDFLEGKNVNTILITRTGDESLNLPNANIVIQTSFHHGSNNQEMQRLGRILRPKKGSTGDIDGYFYSLVSKGTREVFYTRTRRKLVAGVTYEEEEATTDPSVEIPSVAQQKKQLKTALEAYSDNTYMDYANLSDYAKTTQRDLADLAKRRAAAVVEQEAEDSEEDEEINDSASENEEEVVAVNTTNGGEKNVEQEPVTTTTTTVTTSAAEVSDTNNSKETRLSGNKRTQPDSAVASSRGPKVQLPTSKVFAPTIAPRRK